jgi:septum formation protein
MSIILASGSPRRFEILKKHGIDPIVIPSDADETLPPEYETRSVEDIVKYLAHIKAGAVYDQLKDSGAAAIKTLIPDAAKSARATETTDIFTDKTLILGAAKNARATETTDIFTNKTLILGADTIVYKDGIIGKPKDEADAIRILSLLRNTAHLVITGVALIDLSTGEETQFAETTKVFFKDYSDEEIKRFIREEPPYDKSGSYAIQSSWTKNVDHIEGDLENVIGLPWPRLAEYLR